MRFKLISTKTSAAKRRGGFTLVEVLAALVFMAIVIPTAVQGLRVANLAGLIGVRKAAAARIAERELNELLVTRQWQTGAQSGTVQEGPLQFRWSMRTDPWNQLSQKMITTSSSGTGANLLRLLTVEVTFPLQGQFYSVRLSTIVDPSFQ